MMIQPSESFRCHLIVASNLWELKLDFFAFILLNENNNKKKKKHTYAIAHRADRPMLASTYDANMRICFAAHTERSRAGFQNPFTVEHMTMSFIAIGIVCWPLHTRFLCCPLKPSNRLLAPASFDVLS